MDLSRFKDRKFLRRINAKGYSGWQFVFERKTYNETKHFNDNKLGGIDKSYEAAIKYRNDLLEAAGELGLVDESLSGRHTLPLVLTLSPRNTSGIVGVSRASREREGRKAREEAWLSNYKNNEGKHKQQKFSISVHGEKNALALAIKHRRDYEKKVLDELGLEEDIQYVQDHIDELDHLLEYVDDLVDDSDVFFFLGTINNPLLKNTQKQDILNVRIGQRKFRQLVLDYWGHKCAVKSTKWFLSAGHIKPWRDSDNTERLDVYNGLALYPNYDKAFDEGYISFDANGKILISSKIREEITLLGIGENDSISGLNFMHQKYLEYHRNNIYKA
jgi:hypothetical protein